jgi:hypothetical protein
MLLLLAAGSIDPKWSRLPPPLAGSIDAGICFWISAGLALLLLLFGLTRSWRAAAGWLALALLGQAATLQLVSAGPVVGYQHLRVFSLDRPDLPYLAVLALQGLLVAFVLLRRREAVVGLARRLGTIRVLGVLALGCALSAFPTRDLALYGTEIVVGGALQLLHLATFVVAVGAIPAATGTAWSRRLAAAFPAGASAADDDGEVDTRMDPVAIGAAVAVFVVSGVLAFLSYERHPHIPDEVGFVFGARYMAEGVLTIPAPPVPEAFDAFLVAFDGERCYSAMPPGWPLALAVGYRVGLPWLVNPLLAALFVVLAWRLALELYDRRIARLVALLAAVSPWHVFMGMSLLSHPFTGCALLLALLGAFRLRRTGRLRYAVPAGLGSGLVLLARPLEGVAAVLLVGLLALRIRGRWLSPKPIAALALVGIASCGLTLAYNRAITGEATSFPVAEYMAGQFGEGRNSLGFGPERGLGWPGVDPLPGHGAPDIAVNAALNTVAIHIELLGWSAGSLLPLLLLPALGRPTAADRWLGVVALVVIGLHSLYWFSGGPDFGARYWYLLLFPCLALTARGLVVLGKRLGSRETGGASGFGPVLVLAAMMSLGAIVNFLPWRAVDKYHGFRSMRPDLRGILASRDFGDALLLVRGKRHPDYASAVVFNPPADLSADAPILAWDRTPEVRRRLLEAYPDRPIWLIDGPSITGGRFRVVDGPLQAEDLETTAPVLEGP